MFSQRLKQLRELKGLSKAELAREVGIPRTTLSRYENGEDDENDEVFSLPRRKRVKVLADYFGVSVDYLLGISDKPVTYTKKEEDILANLDLNPELPMETLLRQAMEKYTVTLDGRPATEEEIDFMFDQVKAKRFIKETKKDHSN